MICVYPDTGNYSESQFLKFLSNTKNGANFNLPTPYGRTTIHEKLSASGRSWVAKHDLRWGIRPYPPCYTIYGWMTKNGFQFPICLYCSNCTKFGQFILRKIIKIVATRFQILWLKCNKFDFGRGSAPDPAGGAYSAPQTP